MTGSCIMLTCIYDFTSLFVAVIDDTCRFVDRDMVMRYLGGGVGHQATRNVVPVVQHDEEEENIPLEAYHGQPGEGEEDEDHNAGDLNSVDGDADQSDVSDSPSESGESDIDDLCDPEDGECVGEEVLAMEGYGEL
jgi:hypothetical protein